MNIINTKIVPAAQNIFWEDLPPSWQSLGACRCLVLTKEYAAGSPEEQTLLKMLAACKLSPDEYHILQFQEGQQSAWHKLRSQLSPQTVLLLGINPAALGIAALFRLHEPNRYNDCTFIPAHSLTEMDRQPEAKKDFWARGLKPVFVP